MNYQGIISNPRPGRVASLPVFLALFAALMTVLAGCSDTVIPETVRALDRPSAASFSCYGWLQVDGEAVISPQPVESCVGWRNGEPPAGQESLPGATEPTERPLLLSFVLQTIQGSVAILQYGGINPYPIFVDPDRFTPGLNSVPVGTLPVDIATDPTGCHVLTANAGSCDLSILDVASVMQSDARPAVQRLAVKNAAGELIGARPRAMVGDPSAAEIGVACLDAPDSLVYIAYPECHTVAVVSTATGEAVAGVVFRDDGSVEITDGNVGCAGQCGAVAADPMSTAARPSVLEIDGDTRRLYIGAENLAALTIVDLDESYLPAAVSSLPVEGDVGLVALAVSDPVSYDLVGSPYRFVYAAATDGTVRVIEIEREFAECDTQVDTRYLHTEADRTFLPCMPVGDPRTPPRRLGARSPGIHMSGDAVALDVVFAEMDNVPDGSPPSLNPLIFDGYFAYITLSSGRVAIVNINDRRYDDIESPPVDDPQLDDPLSDIALGLAHQIRDFGTLRDQRWADCQFPPVELYPANTLTPRLETEIGYLGSTEKISVEKAHLLPSMHRILCEDSDGLASVPELSIMAPEAVRRFAYPDFLGVPVQEDWDLIWEGAISRDTSSTAVDGPAVRSGFFTVGAGVEFGDGSSPFCKMGVNPYDILSVVGCDPSRGDADCGLGQQCYVHPDASAAVGTGLCLPEDRISELSGLCRDFLTTRRRYTIHEVDNNRLVLGERRRVLRTTPLAGCSSAEQCVELHDRERALAMPDHPADLEIEPSPYTWACEADPSRAPGPPRCVMTCQSNDECEDGYACSAGRCVAGALPPAQCVQLSQRYQVRVGDAFALIGSQTGFVHNRVVDAATGQCIDDPSGGDPLAVGRVPLSAPACAGDGITDMLPNPCTTTVEQVEPYTVWNTDDGTCQSEGEGLITRETKAIRVRNPAFTFHLVDLETTGDGLCNGDRGGVHAPYPTVFGNYRMSFRVIGGHVPGALSLLPQNGTRRMAYPLAIERGPYGRMWIMDQGDRSSSIRGQVVWFEPDQPTGLYTTNYLQ